MSIMCARMYVRACMYLVVVLQGAMDVPLLLAIAGSPLDANLVVQSSQPIAYSMPCGV